MNPKKPDHPSSDLYWIKLIWNFTKNHPVHGIALILLIAAIVAVVIYAACR